MEKIVKKNQKVEVLSFIGGSFETKAQGGDAISLSLDNIEKLDDFLDKHAPLIDDVYSKTVCFTGNRPASLPWKYNEDCDLCLNFKKTLDELLYKVISKGYTNFIVGMAMGFDMIVAERLLLLKTEQHLPIFIECALPCLNQSERWPLEYKNRYEYLIEKADHVTNVSVSPYYNGCCQKRNMYMVDRASLVIAGVHMRKGGTLSTSEYAKKHEKPIIEIRI